MLKIEFDPANKPLAMALGVALVQYGSDDVKMPESETVAVGDVSHTTTGRKATTAELAAGYGGKVEVQQAEQNSGYVAEQETPDAGKSAETAADQDTPTTSSEAGAAASDDDAPTDDNGVPHNAKYCVGLSAQNKFYKSGPNKGAWIKGRGVDESAYNEWYASAMPDEQEEPEAVDTSAAFGGQTAAQSSDELFTKTGDLMEWVSEKQNAELLSQADINGAYSETGITVPSLFVGTDEDKAKNVGTIHKYLIDVLDKKKKG